MPKTKGVRLSIIIVNYNVHYFLEQALQSVRKAIVGLEAEVFVVDNNSIDGSVEMVRRKFPEVHLIANSDNPGFSKANNQAIEKARGEYVLLLNPDTVVEEDTFRLCLEFMDNHPDGGGLGVRMIDGSGQFLPESKRGFPNPKVAFFKVTGLSRLFSKSRFFNHYHLGYLDEMENHEVEVLSGAFMMLRKSMIDEIGMLDDTFFMYGEDIDLSYRIIKAGYKNYYFSGTTIIHYKGESTKKGSLNYVKTFYQAMIIFARKHFQGEKARVFVLMLQLAIYLRAFVTLVNGFLKKAWLPITEAALMAGGLVLIKDLWATHYHHNPDYYQSSFYYINLPLYILFWQGGIFFTGGYDKPWQFRRLVRGLLIGSLFLAAVYGFLPLEYRPSRAIILMGAIWSGIATIGLRTILHLVRNRNLDVGRERDRNLVIVGSAGEAARVEKLLAEARVRTNLIGRVSVNGKTDANESLSNIDRLDDVTYIYKVDEIIFCGKDVPAQSIMHWMSRLGPNVGYRILPNESLSIIGSSSKNAAGELYTIDIQFAIAQPMLRRNKRVLDLIVAILLLLASPFIIWFQKRPKGLLPNIFRVLFGYRSWVGYASDNGRSKDLPQIRKGILSTTSGLQVQDIDKTTTGRLNFFYAKDYRTASDLDILARAWHYLGNKADVK
ncbi:MAG: glycosyltransferase [Bacteroidetes bacterium]|nr:glycosyltransferase [Bacteroidota bacterium]